MHSIILIAHVCTMILSLVLMSAALGLGVFGKKTAVVVATLGEAVTIVGALSGVLLLLNTPLSIQCALLTAYVAAMTSLYVFGFGMGNAEEARFVRSTE